MRCDGFGGLVYGYVGIGDGQLGLGYLAGTRVLLRSWNESAWRGKVYIQPMDGGGLRRRLKL